MADDFPQWVKERACELANADPGYVTYAPAHFDGHGFSGALLALARVVQRYEKPPVDRVKSEARAILAQSDAARTPSPQGDDMAAFGASDIACYLYPGRDQSAERAAFCEGAARHAPSPRGKALEEALRKYGRHYDGGGNDFMRCRGVWPFDRHPCTCGLNAALRDQEQGR